MTVFIVPIVYQKAISHTMAKTHHRCTHCFHNQATKCGLDYAFFNLKASRKCVSFSDKRALPKKTTPNTETHEGKPKVRIYENEKVKYFFYV